LLHGGKPVVDGLLAHPDVRAISSVGSTGSRDISMRKPRLHGKRVQCQGGAKNHVLVLPDADLETSTRIVGDSAFGCAGQTLPGRIGWRHRGDAQKQFTEEIAKFARFAVGRQWAG